MDTYTNTRVMKTSRNSFIVLYTDFKHQAEDGQFYKSIKLIEVVVDPNY
jgi:hypothetical protein